MRHPAAVCVARMPTSAALVDLMNGRSEIPFAKHRHHP